MRIATEKLDFEKAIQLRDTLEALKAQLSGTVLQKEYVNNKKDAKKEAIKEEKIPILR